MKYLIYNFALFASVSAVVTDKELICDSLSECRENTQSGVFSCLMTAPPGCTYESSFISNGGTYDVLDSDPFWVSPLPFDPVLPGALDQMQDWEFKLNLGASLRVDYIETSPYDCRYSMKQYADSSILAGGMRNPYDTTYGFMQLYKGDILVPTSSMDGLWWFMVPTPHTAECPMRHWTKVTAPPLDLTIKYSSTNHTQYFSTISNLSVKEGGCSLNEYCKQLTGGSIYQLAKQGLPEKLTAPERNARELLAHDALRACLDNTPSTCTLEFDWAFNGKLNETCDLPSATVDGGSQYAYRLPSPLPELEESQYIVTRTLRSGKFNLGMESQISWSNNEWRMYSVFASKSCANVEASLDSKGMIGSVGRQLRGLVADCWDGPQDIGSVLLITCEGDEKGCLNKPIQNSVALKQGKWHFVVHGLA